MAGERIQLPEKGRGQDTVKEPTRGRTNVKVIEKAHAVKAETYSEGSGETGNTPESVDVDGGEETLDEDAILGDQESAIGLPERDEEAPEQGAPDTWEADQDFFFGGGCFVTERDFRRQKAQIIRVYHDGNQWRCFVPVASFGRYQGRECPGNAKWKAVEQKRYDQERIAGWLQEKHQRFLGSRNVGDFCALREDGRAEDDSPVLQKQFAKALGLNESHFTRMLKTLRLEWEDGVGLGFAELFSKETQLVAAEQAIAKMLAQAHYGEEIWMLIKAKGRKPAIASDVAKVCKSVDCSFEKVFDYHFTKSSEGGIQ